MGTNKTYIWKNQGRLGNLIIQYEFIKKIIPEHQRIYGIDNGLGNFIKINNNFRLLNISASRKLRNYLNNKFNCFLSFLCEKMVVSQLKPQQIILYKDYQSEDELLTTKVGFFKNIIVIEGYFQFLDLKNVSWIYQKAYQNCFNLHSTELMNNGCSSVAVHVRKGDYINLDVLGSIGADLPFSWYKSAIAFTEKIYPDALFYIYTDDNSVFEDFNFISKRVLVNSGDMYEDFVKLSAHSICIISASTYSLAATSFNNRDKLIIAPKYWLGFKSNMWFPYKIKNDFIYYI